MSEFRYKAFISYSHRDERWASWLHRALEAYRVPRKLVGSSTDAGEVPARLHPVFRDREDLSSAADLSTKVTEALTDSENLIVICSPAAAASRWVKEEIREFTRLGRGDRIFCMIVDGEADESGSIAAVFPDAIAEAGLHEPLAADARKWADGKQLAKLKLIAGMLGLPLDQLRRRELRRRRKNQALAAVAAVAIAAILAIAVMSRMAAEQRRDSGESWVASKLTELRTMLEVRSDPEDLERLRDWDPEALAMLVSGAGAEPGNLRAGALRLRDRGMGLWEEGDVLDALDRFKDSWALLALDYRANREDAEAFFELGQAEYWIGRMHWDLGELELAESAFMSYAEITRRLIERQPENSQWVLEMAYALTNLGDIEKARHDINPDRVERFMQSALDYNNIALVLDPNNELYESELGQSLANLADAQRNICDLEGALQSRMEGVRQETALLEDDPDDPDRQLNLALALTGHAWVQAGLGRNAEARKNYEQAVLLIERASRRAPDARRARLDLAKRRQLMVWLDAMNGDLERAWADSEALAEDWRRLVDDARLDDLESILAYASHLLDRAWLASDRGEPAAAMVLLDEALATLASEARRLPNNRDIGNALTLAAYRYWEIRHQLPPPGILSLLPDYQAYNGRTRACLDAARAVQKAVMQGSPAQAGELVTYLLDRGYRESGFMRICSEHFTC